MARERRDPTDFLNEWREARGPSQRLRDAHQQEMKKVREQAAARKAAEKK